MDRLLMGEYSRKTHPNQCRQIRGSGGVNAANDIYYRTGTYGDVDTAGSGWVKVPGKLKWLASGTDLLVGVNSANDIFYRKGMTAQTPTGTGWVKVPGKLAQIDVHEDEVVGTNPANQIYRSPVKPIDGEKEDSEDEDQDSESETASVQTAITAAWAQVPGGLTRISKGNSGIWGVECK